MTVRVLGPLVIARFLGFAGRSSTTHHNATEGRDNSRPSVFAFASTSQQSRLSNYNSIADAIANAIADSVFELGR